MTEIDYVLKDFEEYNGVLVPHSSSGGKFKAISIVFLLSSILALVLYFVTHLKIIGVVGVILVLLLLISFIFWMYDENVQSVETIIKGIVDKGNFIEASEIREEVRHTYNNLTDPPIEQTYKVIIGKYTNSNGDENFYYSLPIDIHDKYTSKTMRVYLGENGNYYADIFGFVERAKLWGMYYEKGNKSC